MTSSDKKTIERQQRERAALDTTIRSQLPTDAYRDGWERVFGAKRRAAAPCVCWFHEPCAACRASQAEST